VRKADNLSAIRELIFYKIWEPRHLTTLYASMTCNRDSFNSFFLLSVCLYCEMCETFRFAEFRVYCFVTGVHLMKTLGKWPEDLTSFP
jgi:hypothetical protein